MQKLKHLMTVLMIFISVLVYPYIFRLFLTPDEVIIEEPIDETHDREFREIVEGRTQFWRVEGHTQSNTYVDPIFFVGPNQGDVIEFYGVEGDKTLTHPLFDGWVTSKWTITPWYFYVVELDAEGAYVVSLTVDIFIDFVDDEVGIPIEDMRVHSHIETFDFSNSTFVYHDQTLSLHLLGSFYPLMNIPDGLRLNSFSFPIIFE